MLRWRLWYEGRRTFQPWTFSTPDRGWNILRYIKTKHFNPRVLNPKLQPQTYTRFIVEKFGVEEFMVEKSGVEKLGLKHGVEMSFKWFEDPSRRNHLRFKKWHNWNLEQENFEKGIVFRGSTWKCASKPQFQLRISIRAVSREAKLSTEIKFGSLVR